MANAIEIEIRGLREAQRRLERALERLGVGGGLEALIARGTLRAHRYATAITHVDTGRLKNSHFPRVQAAGNTVYGVVGTNVSYAIYEHARGGTHAFYARTVKEEGPAIVAEIAGEVARIAGEANG